MAVTCEEQQEDQWVEGSRRAVGDEVRGVGATPHGPCGPLEGLWCQGREVAVDVLNGPLQDALKEEWRHCCVGERGIKMTPRFLAWDNFLVSVKATFWEVRLHSLGSEFS